MLEMIIVLLGVVVGGVLGIGGQFLMEWRREKAKGKQVARAFAGEIGALVKIIKLRDYAGGMRAVAARLRSGVDSHMSVGITREYFNVYNAHVGNLGLLGDDLPEKVAKFYTTGSALYEDFRASSEEKFKALTLSSRADVYEAVSAMLDVFSGLGGELVKELKKFAK